MTPRSRRAPDLKMRALTWLAQREHSASELRTKLLRLAQRSAEDTADAADEAQEGGNAQDASAQVDALLVWLQERGYLSEERFVASRLHTRASRWGERRISQELAQHGLELDTQQRAELRATELDRARALWQRKFGTPPQDERERARQLRFMAARGFEPGLLQRLWREAAEG
ncbi:regulatory protein RecX [Roseateles sp. BYS180W]|uniref:Regulatory protein RecX n=1 Tax=Roseateles rivi TaxID=3299028 RepID=A0ABW7FUL5_9BURK